MTYIFYDFETSSKELIGQILSYAFVVTDSNLEIIEHLEGLIKLNRTQCPDVDAILTNKIDVLSLQKHGETEFNSATKIFNFLSKIIQKHEKVTLVGFNSNQFDLSFLRNLLIRNGLNPYFSGKLLNKDILHWSQYLAFYHAEEFPWTKQQKEDSAYYSFKLEDITHSSNLIDSPQTHNALEDVLLTIKLVTYFESKFNEKLHDFNAYQLPESLNKNKHSLLKQRTRHYPIANTPLEKYINTYFLPLNINSKTQLYINLSKLSQVKLTELSNEEKITYINYKNANKHFFIAQDATEEEAQSYSQLIKECLEDPFFKQFLTNANYYFEFNKKSWDIEYQIHELGFNHIDTLNALIKKMLNSESSYLSQLKELMSNKKDQKDIYLIQLFNRFYLNNHSNPEPNLLQRYLNPKYIIGSLYRDPCEENLFKTQFNYLKTKLDTLESEQDLEILKSLQTYYEEFKKLLTTSVNA
jgi:hypothetical protein